MLTFLEKLIAKKAEEQSSQLEKWRKKHESEVTFPDTVQEVKGVPYIEDGEACHRMDIYYPKKAEGKLPVIINIHGGGLLLGSKEVNRLFCGTLSEMGFLVFCPEYPLVPKKQIYEIFADVNTAINKIASLLEQYSGDREKVYLVGDSAGAYLITYLTAMQKSSALAEAAGVTPYTLPVKALGFISGMFYTRKRDEVGMFLTSWIYGKNWRKHAFRPYMNPEHEEIVKNLPPCFLVTSGGDTMKSYTLEFYEALQKAGTVCHLEDYAENKELIHAFCTLFPEKEESVAVIKKMTEYFL